MLPCFVGAGARLGFFSSVRVRVAAELVAATCSQQSMTSMYERDGGALAALSA